MALNFTQISLSKNEFNNRYSDAKCLVKSVFTKPPEYNFNKSYSFDHLAMKNYLLVLFQLNQNKEYILTSFNEIYSIVNSRQSISDIALKRSKFYTILLETINWLVDDNLIELFTLDDSPLILDEVDSKYSFCTKEPFLIKLNTNLLTVAQDSSSKKYTETYVAIKNIEFNLILKSASISPLKRVRTLYLYIYIKSKMYTHYTKELDNTYKRFSYSKITFEAIMSDLGLSRRAINDYFKVLTDTVLIKYKIKGFVCTDEYGREKIFGAANTYCCKYDGYYEGIQRDIYYKDREITNKYLEQNNYERINVNE